jgi:indolepyruvate ferredoxin oxidoreductase alpha subunit
MTSSVEIDSRSLAALTRLPVLEPSTPQEAKEMVRQAFDLSEEVGMMVIVRVVTRLCHGHGEVECGPLPPVGDDARFDVSRPYSAAPSQFLPLTRAALKKLTAVQERFELSPFNALHEEPGADVLVVAAGLGWMYARESADAVHLPPASFLKIGTPYPFPDRLALRAMRGKRRVLVLEETDPWIEERLKILAADLAEEGSVPVVLGRGRMGETGLLERYGELSNDVVRRAYQRVFGVELPQRSLSFSERASQLLEGTLPVRQLSFCAGCSHRESYWAIKAALTLDGRDGFVSGDIGCYGLANGPTGYNLIKVQHCMGSGAGMLGGFGKLERFGWRQPVIAVCGDSTFFHSAIPALINARINGSRGLFVLLDNTVTAMTGMQPNPGSGFLTHDGECPTVAPEAITRAIGLSTEVLDPVRVADNIATLVRLLQKPELSVAIFRRPCVIHTTRRHGGPAERVWVEQDACLGDACGCNRFCVRILGCPANKWDEGIGKAYVDMNSCSACGLCVSLCPSGAIRREASSQGGSQP